jgi:hypothetical protein
MGGKSRKSGGVSKKLIAHIKNNSSGKSQGKKSCGSKPKQPSKGIFDGDE